MTCLRQVLQVKLDVSSAPSKSTNDTSAASKKRALVSKTRLTPYHFSAQCKIRSWKVSENVKTDWSLGLFRRSHLRKDCTMTCWITCLIGRPNQWLKIQKLYVIWKPNYISLMKENDLEKCSRDFVSLLEGTFIRRRNVTVQS